MFRPSETAVLIVDGAGSTVAVASITWTSY